MTIPVITLDQRYGDPEAVPTGWDEARRVLETAELFWITTVRADGCPHVTPLVAVWVSNALHFCTGLDEQKAVNLRHSSHVVLTTGRNDWDTGLDVVVEGDAVRVTDAAVLGELARAWTAKWGGQWQYEVAAGGFTHPGGDETIGVFSVSPAQIFAFSKGPFSQTKYRFTS
jgi:general stress protein 26